MIAMRLAILMILLLGGCSGAKVAVPTHFPIPVVDKVPLPIGIYIDENLSSYTHTEMLEGRGEWQIELGSAQQPLFQSLLEGMFYGHRFIDLVVGDNQDVAAILVPSIEELQFSTPKQTRTEYYEVWIRYQFKLYDNRGVLLGEWPLTAYGKSHKQNHGSSSKSLQAAALLACRDAMAFFTLQFRSVPVVKDWLASQLGGS